jgi:signal transduction histidine kinase
MHLNWTTHLMILLAGAVTALQQTLLGTPSLTDLEQRMAEIDTELEQLAHYSPRSGSGSIGYRSPVSWPDADHTEWVQVELEKPTPIDQIIMVPAIWRDTERNYQEDGFPAKFRILAGTDPHSAGTEIAAFSEQDHLLPRIAPLIVPCNTTASWVRVEASILSPRRFDGYFNLELAELMVFNGEENVALRRPVNISSPELYPPHTFALGHRKEYLVDGFMPYQMDSGQGDKTADFTGQAKTPSPTINFDLGKVIPLSRIHFHTVILSDTAPQGIPTGYGLPEHLILEGARMADFSDAVHLMEYRKTSIYDVGPVIMHRFPETLCRYVRLSVPDAIPHHVGKEFFWESRIGFAEIELFSRGENVALGNPVTTEFIQHLGPISRLTDGRNNYGRILSTREWIKQLARRHDLETERPLIDAELKRHYARQKTNLRRMIWLAACLAAGILVTILIDRIVRMRHIANIRDRFAADLHDELGANISTIGILRELARDTESREEQPELLDRLGVFTKRSEAAVRHCTNILEAQGLCDDLAQEMERSAHRLLGGIEHTLSVDGNHFLPDLKPRKRIDLFFFYKECLNNIVRHAAATKVSIRLIVDSKKLTLTVTDNGIGLPNGPPPSLKRRARFLGAQLSAEKTTDGDTRIILNLKSRKWIHLK